MNRRTFLLAAPLAAAGCRSRESRVVLYCAQDREFAEELLADFTRETGVRVDAKYDTEANKSVALAAELEQERERPRCDVHWNNEPIGSVRLARAGVYTPIPESIGNEFPAETRPADRMWQGFAARARIIIVNTDSAKEIGQPHGLAGLAAERWKGRVAIAKPFFGTTATHAACLAAALGQVRTRTYFEQLKANGVNVVAGNKQVAQGVAEGRFAVGITDTDDAVIELRAKKPVAIVFPTPEPGTLFLPNTVALVKGGPNPEAAKKLVAFLLRAETEKRLAEGGGFQIPLNPAVKAELPATILRPTQTRAMAVSFDAAAAQWEQTQAMLRELFAG
jgi:iron(III) transport system substrate-binding protein